MRSIIHALLDLWDPYHIGLFSPDEYTGYAKRVGDFLEDNPNIDYQTFTDFVYDVAVPPFEEEVKKYDKSVVSIGYERFAKVSLMIWRRYFRRKK